MSNEQKLREALLIAVNYIDMDALYTFAGGDHDTIKEALATTEPEPEPTGMPELPEADVSFEDGKDQYGYPEYDHAFSLERIKNYGEQCWKAGYKHGAWGDKPPQEPAVPDDVMSILRAIHRRPSDAGIWLDDLTQILRNAATDARKPLTEVEMEKGREQLFSTNNPYCPCDRKTFKKVAEWVERHHGIAALREKQGGV